LDIRVDGGCEDGSRLLLSGALTIQQAAAAKPALLAPVTASPRVEFDLSALSALDAAGVQLLMLCKREAERVGCRLELANHSAAVVDQFELFNLAGYFGDPLLLRTGEAP